jgi:hypothetical protein
MAAFQIEQSQQQIRATVISSGNVVPGSLDDFRINLAPARKRYAEQERDQQACQRRLPRDGANGRKRLAGQSRVRNGTAQPVDRSLQCSRDFRDRARHVGCSIDSAFRHAGLRCFDVHDSSLSRLSLKRDETATFGYPRVRSF